MTTFPKLAALAVLPHDGQLLLVRRRNEPDAGLWGFPGGHVELGERGVDAAMRELREETTILAEPLDYLTNIDVIVKGNGGGIAHHFLLAAVLCRFRSGTAQAQDDVSQAGWFDFDQVLSGDLQMSAHVDTVLQLALNRLPQR